MRCQLGCGCGPPLPGARAGPRGEWRGGHPPAYAGRRPGCRHVRASPPQSAPSEPEDEDTLAGGGSEGGFRPYPAFRLLAQCLTVTLSLGAGGVDLAGRALFYLPAPALDPDQAAVAAAATEALTLAAVVALFSAAAQRPEGGVRAPVYGASLESALIGVGGAAGGCLLATAFAAAWGVLNAAGGGFPSPAALDSPTTDAVAALLTATSPTGAAALLVASTVLAPAVEELSYRGVLLAALLDGGAVGAPAAVALSAAAFAASHAAVAPADVPALFGLGLALGATALAGGRVGHGRRNPGAGPVDLGAATLAHALYNAGVLAAAAAGLG